MWYYVAGFIVVSRLTDIIVAGEKLYGICNGVYKVLNFSKNYFCATKNIEFHPQNDDDEWIELKLFKNESCQTI